MSLFDVILVLWKTQVIEKAYSLMRKEFFCHISHTSNQYLAHVIPHVCCGSQLLPKDIILRFFKSYQLRCDDYDTRLLVQSFIQRK